MNHTQTDFIKSSFVIENIALAHIRLRKETPERKHLNIQV